MEITLLGFIFLLTSIILFKFHIKYFIYLILICCIFQSTAIFNVSGKGFYFNLIGEIIVILRYILLSKTSIRTVILPNYLKYAFLFIIYISVIFFISPLLFSGYKIYGTSAIDYDVETGGQPLVFSFGKITQIVSIFIHFTFTYILTKYAKYFSINSINNLILITAIIVTFIGLWEFISKTFEIIPFPTSIFSNYAGAGLLTDQKIFGFLKRLNSVFHEPSFAGAYLGSVLWALLSINKVNFYLTAFFVSIALIFNLSGTGILTASFGTILFLVFTRIKYIPYILITIIGFYIIANSLGFDEFIKLMLETKSDSNSGINRLTSIFFSIDLFIKTCGIGVGYGYHRSSSLFTNLLAGTGILGTMFFLIFLYNLIMPIIKRIKYDKEMLPPIMYVLCMFFAQNISVPDLSFPPFWLGIYICAIINSLIFQKHDK